MSGQDRKPLGLESGEVDLGNDTVAIWTEKHGNVIGIIERHYCVIPAGEGIDVPDEPDHIGGGYISLDPADATHWTIEAGTAGDFTGLTLSPSVLCRRCGHHGWIRDGRWIPA